MTPLRAIAAAVSVIGLAMLAASAPTAAAQGGPGEPPSASSELQGEYPLRESMRCCRTFTRALPTPPLAVRPASGDAEGSSSPPWAALIALFAVGVLALTLFTRATLSAVRERRTRLALPDDLAPSEPYAEPPPRPAHPVSPVVIRLALPFFRYSYGLHAYVLRLIGARHGPVLTERRSARRDPLGLRGGRPGRPQGADEGGESSPDSVSPKK
jgi:hypothetical protein